MLCFCETETTHNGNDLFSVCTKEITVVNHCYIAETAETISWEDGDYYMNLGTNQ